MKLAKEKDALRNDPSWQTQITLR